MIEFIYTLIIFGLGIVVGGFWMIYQSQKSIDKGATIIITAMATAVRKYFPREQAVEIMKEIMDDIAIQTERMRRSD